MAHYLRPDFRLIQTIVRWANSSLSLSPGLDGGNEGSSKEKWPSEAISRSHRDRGGRNYSRRMIDGVIGQGHGSENQSQFELWLILGSGLFLVIASRERANRIAPIAPWRRIQRSWHYGSEQPEFGTSKFTLSHELGSKRTSEWCE